MKHIIRFNTPNKRYYLGQKEPDQTAKHPDECRIVANPSYAQVFNDEIEADGLQAGWSVVFRDLGMILESTERVAPIKRTSYMLFRSEDESIW